MIQTVRARLEQVVDNVVDRERVRDLLDHESLVPTSMDISQIMRIRENMERAAARRLQPYYITAFFVQAFEPLGGTCTSVKADATHPQRPAVIAPGRRNAASAQFT